MFLKWFDPRKIVVGALVLLAFSVVSPAQDTAKRGRKYKAPPPTAKLEVTVVRASNGKPVENASVIFHPLEDGKHAGNMELKTNDEGKTVIDLLQIGSDVRLQIIAKGFQTYGEDYKIDKENMALEIKLKRPADQYSIYEKGEGRTATPKSEAAPKTDAPKDASPADAPKDASKPDAAPK